MSYRGKRALDLIFTVPALVITLPAQFVIAAAVRMNMGRPIFFVQERPGLGGVPFTLVKFRTMLEPNDSRIRNDDASRLTRLGRLMRSTSVDELPTLWNVVRGDMSLVGPRPLLIQYLDVYSPTEAKRHDVRPGLTGLAQVNGRNELAWEDRFAYDLEYVRYHSLIDDVGILIRSVLSVLQQQGISASGHATMPAFRGTECEGTS